MPSSALHYLAQPTGHAYVTAHYGNISVCTQSYISKADFDCNFLLITLVFHKIINLSMCYVCHMEFNSNRYPQYMILWIITKN